MDARPDGLTTKIAKEDENIKFTLMDRIDKMGRKAIRRQRSDPEFNYEMRERYEK